jgi:oxygen-independent coproporphyrinogen-3 oxidase
MLEAAGYVRVGLDHYARATDSMAKALATGEVHRNFQGYTTDGADSLIGLGASAIGRLHGGYVQNSSTVVEWRGALAADRLPVARGIALSEDDRLRGAIIEQLMCAFRVDLACSPANPVCRAIICGLNCGGCSLSSMTTCWCATGWCWR